MPTGYTKALEDYPCLTDGNTVKNKPWQESRYCESCQGFLFKPLGFMLRYCRIINKIMIMLHFQMIYQWLLLARSVRQGGSLQQ